MVTTTVHTGVVSTWVWQERTAAGMYTNQQVHSAGIAFLLWNPAGTRLITGDKVRRPAPPFPHLYTACA
jgi:hypothetical protein